MIQAGINGDKYDNMNPKTFSEPQNNEEGTLDCEDGGQKIQNDSLNDTQKAKNDTQ